MNNNDLQTLIDLPSGQDVVWLAPDDDMFICTTDTLIARATELRDRRYYCEYVEICLDRSQPVSSFEDWQDARRISYIAELGAKTEPTR